MQIHQVGGFAHSVGAAALRGRRTRGAINAARRPSGDHAADSGRRQADHPEVRETIHQHKVDRARASVGQLHVEPVQSITAPTIKTEPVESGGILNKSWDQATAGSVNRSERKPHPRALADRDQWENRFRDVVHALARLDLAARRDEHQYHVGMVAADPDLRGEVTRGAILLHEGLGDRRQPERVQQSERARPELNNGHGAEPPVQGPPKNVTGKCELLTINSTTPRNWTVRRMNRFIRSTEPVTLVFTTPSGRDETVYEIPPNEARNLAQALIAFAEWLEPSD
jgi:hypothetical protein